MSVCTYSMLNVFASAMLILYSLQPSDSSKRAQTHVPHVICVLLAHRCETGNILMMRLFASSSIRCVRRRFCFQPIYVSKTKQECILLNKIQNENWCTNAHVVSSSDFSQYLQMLHSLPRAYIGIGTLDKLYSAKLHQFRIHSFSSVLLEFPCGNMKRRRCIRSLVTRNTGNLENHFKSPKCRRLAFFGVRRRLCDI